MLLRNEIRVQPVPYHHSGTVESVGILHISVNFRGSVTEIFATKPPSTTSVRIQLIDYRILKCIFTGARPVVRLQPHEWQRENSYQNLATFSAQRGRPHVSYVATLP